MTDAIVIEDAGERGIIESIAVGKPKPVGFIVNCPVVYRINRADSELGAGPTARRFLSPTRNIEMIKHFITAALVTCAATLVPSLSEARQPAQIMAGDPSGPNVVFSFDQDDGSKGLRIETHLVGNPGAKLSIWVDHSKLRLFSRVLTTSDCKYGDDGAKCRIVIDRKNPDYRRFAVAFKRGRTAHIEVENAGVMQMSNDISLAGFTRKLGSQS